MLDSKGMLEPPYSSETLGFSTSIVVTIRPPAPRLQTESRDCVSNSVSRISVWKVPVGSLMRPPQTCGICVD